MTPSRNDVFAVLFRALVLLGLSNGLFAQVSNAAPVSPVKAGAASAVSSDDRVLQSVERLREDVRALRQDIENVRKLLETGRGKSGTNPLPERIRDDATAGAGPKAPLPANGVYFFDAERCLPCREMRPVVERLKCEGFPILDVNVDRRADLRHEFHIDTVPAFVLVIGGKEKERATGMQDEAQLRALLAKIPHCPLSSARSTATPNAVSNAKADRKTTPAGDAAVYPPAATGHHPPRSAHGAADNPARYEPRAYPVADLVLRVPGKGKTNVDENFEKLKRLVTDTIEPASWQSRGGAASITQYDKTLSLIVRQTPAVHRQLRAFLLSLRALQDWQVCLEAIVVENAPAGLLESIGLTNPLAGNGNVLALTEEQRTKLLAASQQDPVANLHLPKVTMFYGQRGSIAPVTNRNEALDLEISDSTDRYAVNLRLGLHDNRTGKATTEPVTVNVPNLKTVVIELKRIGEGPSARPSLLLVRPRLVFPFEEEEVEHETPNNAATQPIEPK
jgi:thiol-disulfide isomerase/thioredoxin